MANELQNNVITVGSVNFTQMCSEFTATNVLTYVETPSRMLDFSLINNDIEASYIPTVDFIFNYVTAAQFALFMQLCNSKGFFVQYYDYEIQTWVKRRMYMTEESISKIRNIGKNYDGIYGLKVTFVSKYGYPYASETDSNYNATNKYHYANVYLAATETRT